jgi:hypothetical protein
MGAFLCVVCLFHICERRKQNNKKTNSNLFPYPTPFFLMRKDKPKKRELKSDEIKNPLFLVLAKDKKQQNIPKKRRRIWKNCFHTHTFSLHFIFFAGGGRGSTVRIPIF